MAHKTWLIFYELIKNFGLGALLIACKKSGTDKYIPTLLKDVEVRSFNKDGVCYWKTAGMKLTSGNIQSTAFMLRAHPILPQ